MNKLGRIGLMVFLALGICFQALAVDQEKLDTQLIHLAAKGGVEDIVTTIQKGGNVNVKDEAGMPLLSIAAIRDDGYGVPVITALLDAKADINATSRDQKTALHYALIQKNPAVTRFLIERGANIYARDNTGRDAKAYATWIGDLTMIDIVDEAIQREKDLLTQAPERERLEKQTSDMVYHASLGRVEDIAALLKAGADPNTKDEKGVPVISIAASRDDSEAMPIVKILLANKADMEATSPDRKTPLMFAITKKNGPLVHYLISNGADFYAMDNVRRSVKAYADWIGDPQIIELIAEAIRLDATRFKEGRSQSRLNKRMDEYVYYNCVLQYWTFYRDSKQDTLEQPAFDNKLAKIRDGLKKAGAELEGTFGMRTGDLEQLGNSARAGIHNDLEELISNRNRRKNGVGSEEDMKKRCEKVLSEHKVRFKPRKQ